MKELDNGNIQETAEKLKAISDPTRLKILLLLNDVPHAVCVNNLASKLDISQSAVSQHLKILRHAGLVESDKRGYFVHYALRKDALKALSKNWRDLFGVDL